MTIRLFAGTAVAAALLLAAPGSVSAAEALIPPKPPAVPATPPAPPIIVQSEQPVPGKELAGSSAVAGQATADAGEPMPTRQRHRRRRVQATHPRSGEGTAAHVDRALADQVTNQLNRRELERLHSRPGPDAHPRAEQLNREQLDQSRDERSPVGTSPTGISRAEIPAPPGPAYLPH